VRVVSGATTVNARESMLTEILHEFCLCIPHEWAAMLTAVVMGVGGEAVVILAELLDMFAVKTLSN
jgi:hypothetical protein